MKIMPTYPFSRETNMWIYYRATGTILSSSANQRKKYVGDLHILYIVGSNSSNFGVEHGWVTSAICCRESILFFFGPRNRYPFGAISKVDVAQRFMRYKYLNSFNLAQVWSFSNTRAARMHARIHVTVVLLVASGRRNDLCAAESGRKPRHLPCGASL